MSEPEQELETLKSFIYDCIVELSYVQSIENCNSGLCATSMGEHLVNEGMKLLGVKDLAAESYSESVIAEATEYAKRMDEK